VHRRVGVQLIDQRHKVGLGGVGIQPVLVGIHPDLDRLLVLGAHIDLARRIFAHQHHRKARRHPVLGLEPINMLCHLPADPRRERLAVDDLCRHVFSFVQNGLIRPAPAGRRRRKGFRKALRSGRHH
jgi:hypothetical protein